MISGENTSTPPAENGLSCQVSGIDVLALRPIVGLREHGVGEPTPERLVSLNCLKLLSVVFQDAPHDACECFVVLDPGILFVSVLFGILICLVGATWSGFLR